MKLAVLFSGGKDSTLALHVAKKYAKIACLVSLHSKNPESFLFHVPNVKWTKLQAQAMKLPLIVKETIGEKETELHDLTLALQQAKRVYKIDGVVSGALASAFQSARFQKVCDFLELECFNPLWQKDQFELLHELQQEKIRAKVVGVFALGMENFLGRDIDSAFIRGISKILGINPAGEGGEYESFVYDSPFFKKRIQIEKTRAEERGGGARVLRIELATLVKK